MDANKYDKSALYNVRVIFDKLRDSSLYTFKKHLSYQVVGGLQRKGWLSILNQLAPNYLSLSYNCSIFCIVIKYRSSCFGTKIPDNLYDIVQLHE